MVLGSAIDNRSAQTRRRATSWASAAALCPRRPHPLLGPLPAVAHSVGRLSASEELPGHVLDQRAQRLLDPNALGGDRLVGRSYTTDRLHMRELEPAFTQTMASQQELGL